MNWKLWYLGMLTVYALMHVYASNMWHSQDIFLFQHSLFPKIQRRCFQLLPCQWRSAPVKETVCDCMDWWDKKEESGEKVCEMGHFSLLHTSVKRKMSKWWEENYITSVRWIRIQDNCIDLCVSKQWKENDITSVRWIRI